MISNNIFRQKQRRKAMEKTLIILGLAVIISILIITICAIFKKDSSNIEIEVIRPWKFSIKIQKDKHYEKDKKNIT